MVNRIREKIRPAFFLCMALCFFTAVLFQTTDCEAKEEQAEDPVTIRDDAALLMEEEADWLKDTAEKLSEKSGWNIIIATCAEATGRTAQQTCEDYFDTYTHGEDGISCLIDMANREIYLATAGEAILCLNDDRIDSILDDAFEAVSEQDYAQCLYLMILGADKAYESGIPDNAKIYDQDTGKTEIYRKLTTSEILFTVLAAIAAGGIVFSVILGRYRLKWGTYQYDFHKSGFFHLNSQQDRLVNKIVTHRHIPKNTNSGANRSSGSRNRSTVHTGSGGRRYGGGGRKF